MATRHIAQTLLTFIQDREYMCSVVGLGLQECHSLLDVESPVGGVQGVGSSTHVRQHVHTHGRQALVDQLLWKPALQHTKQHH